MALYYRTEYRIGNRGRIRRCYTGFPAILAILSDLIFGLIFELIASLIGLAGRLVVVVFQIGVVFLFRSWLTVVALVAALVSILTLPFVVIHRAVGRLWSGSGAGRGDCYAASTLKPNWAMGREV